MPAAYLASDTTVVRKDQTLEEARLKLILSDKLSWAALIYPQNYIAD